MRWGMRLWSKLRMALGVGLVLGELAACQAAPPASPTPTAPLPTATAPAPTATPAAPATALPTASAPPTLTPIPPTTHIHTIQGASHVSPLSFKIVENVPGIVTAKRATGFYLQDPAPDGDDATSEAIFVLTGIPRRSM